MWPFKKFHNDRIVSMESEIIRVSRENRELRMRGQVSDDAQIYWRKVADDMATIVEKLRKK